MKADELLDFTKWTACENDWNGRYRYVVAPKVAYEIMVLYHDLSTPILTAKANLYCVGLWHQYNHFLEREVIAEELPIQELLGEAKEDYLKNFK